MTRLMALANLDRQFNPLQRSVLVIVSLSSLAIVGFLLVASNAPFTSRVTSSLYPKSQSFASGEGFVCNPCSADIDDNGVVGPGDLTDYNLCASKRSGESNGLGFSCSSADVTQDGVVDHSDSECINSQFNKICQK